MKTIYLENFYHDQEMKDFDQLHKKGMGLNMQLKFVTSELVQRMKENGKLLSVWVDASAPEPENPRQGPDFYKKCYDMGVSMIVTDFPQDAQKCLVEYHREKCKMKS